MVGSQVRRRLQSADERVLSRKIILALGGALLLAPGSARAQSTSPCTHTLELHDRAGDGWNGAVLDLFVDDVRVAHRVTLAAGETQRVLTFEAPTGGTLHTTFIPGAFPTEPFYAIQDAHGRVLARDGADDGVPVGVSTTANCLPPEALPGACCYADGTCAVTTAPDCRAKVLGDVTCDGAVTVADVELFLAALYSSDADVGLAACGRERGDCNGDGALDAADLAVLVALLSNAPHVWPASHLGPDSDCTACPAQAPPTGACCLPDGSCIITTATMCGPTYLGDGAPCTGAACLGACCAPDGTCSATLPADCPFQFLGVATHCGRVPCPAPLPGSSCDMPLDLELTAADLPLMLAGGTCGQGNFHHDTCLTYFDTGQETVYRLHVREPLILDIELDPRGTRWTGVAIGTSCDTAAGCLGYAGDSTTAPRTIPCVELQPGTYFVLVDTYAPPNCIPDYTLTLSACTRYPGDRCDNPIVVPLAVGDLPWSGDNTTCGRHNFHDQTCLEFGDTGQDLIYALDILEPMSVDLVLEPHGMPWATMLLTVSCGGYRCIAQVATFSPLPKMIACVPLEPGRYYVQIDSYRPPDCLPALTFTVRQCERPTP